MTTEKRCASIKDEDSRIEFARVEGSSGTHVAVHGYEDHDPERQRAYTYAPESEFLAALDELGYTVLTENTSTDPATDAWAENESNEILATTTSADALAIAASYMKLAARLASDERSQRERVEKIARVESVLPDTMTDPEARYELASQLVDAGVDIPGAGE